MPIALRNLATRSLPFRTIWSNRLISLRTRKPPASSCLLSPRITFTSLRHLHSTSSVCNMGITELEALCVNTIRAVSADQPQAANSGHPGAPMGCAPMAYVLWAEVMKYSGKDSAWINRDRFVLSNGHACALQYTMLHLTGYNVSKKDLSEFRKLGSKTPGHPENFHTDGKVHTSHGPVGMAKQHTRRLERWNCVCELNPC